MTPVETGDDIARKHKGLMGDLRRDIMIGRLAVGLFFVVAGTWIFASLDFEVMLATLQRADTLKIFLYFPVLILTVWLVRAIRWALVLRSAGTKIDPIRIYLSTATSLGLAAVTPVQSGEMLKIKHAVHDGELGIFRALGGFAAERFYDLFVVLVLTVFAALVALKSIAQSFTTVAVIAVGSVVLIVLAANLTPVGRLPSRIVDLLDGFKTSTRRPTVAIGLFGLTVVCWVLNAVLWQVAMSSVGVNVTFAASMAIVGIVSFASLASMMPGGIGVLEVTISGLLIFLGFAPEQAVSAALVLRAISLWMVVLGIMHWALFLRLSNEQNTRVPFPEY